MNKRIELHHILCDILGTNNVYYQPPENLQMKYPCIRYNKIGIESKYADNKKYNNKTRYQIIYIDKNPDNATIEKILDLPLTSFDRHYASNNLHHDVVDIYY